MSRRRHISVLLLGVLMAAMAAAKALDFSGYTKALAAFDLVRGQEHVFGALVIYVESIAAFGLLVAAATKGRWRVAYALGALGALLSSIAFVTITTHAYFTGQTITNCTCFGAYLTQPLNFFVLIQDASMLMWAGWTLWLGVSTFRERHTDRSRSRRVVQATTSVVVTLILFLVSLRIAAPYVVEGVLDDALGALPEHWGSVQDVDLALYRGQYTIIDLNILERNAESIDRPLVSIERADIGVDWDKLLDGHVDARVRLDNARFSVVVAEEAVQTGDSPALREQLLAFVPLDISKFEVNKGRLRFVDQTADPVVDIDVRDIRVVATGLSTRPPVDAKKKSEKLPSKIDLKGSVMGRAPLSLEIALNTFAKPHPHFDLELEMERLPLEALNELTRAYAGFDFEGGTIAFYSELAAANGAIEGYAKPIIAHAEVLDTDGNDADDNIVELAWEAFVGAATMIFEDGSTDTIATQIPIEGRLDQPDVGVFRTVVNLIGHAFFETISARPNHSISIEDVLRRSSRG